MQWDKRSKTIAKLDRQTMKWYDAPNENPGGIGWYHASTCPRCEDKTRCCSKHGCDAQASTPAAQVGHVTFVVYYA
jgi:hypothetical protein